MTRRTFPERVERGGDIARALLNVVFRLFCLGLFLPPAWSAMMRGDWLACGLSVACAFGFGALLAPMKT